MKVTRWKPPYIHNDRRRTTFNIRNKGGVYLIKLAGEIRYIGRSAKNAYSAMYRHFQSWDDPRQKRATYEPIYHWRKNDFLVRIVYIEGKRQAILETALIKKYDPPDNPYKPEETEQTAQEHWLSDVYEEEVPF